MFRIPPLAGPGGASPEPVVALDVDAAARRVMVSYAQEDGYIIGQGLAFDTTTGAIIGKGFDGGDILAVDATTHRAVAVALLSSNTSQGLTVVDTVDTRTGRSVREEQPENGRHGVAALSIDRVIHHAYLATMRYGSEGEADTPSTALYVIDTRTGHVIPGPDLPGGSTVQPRGSLALALAGADARLAVIAPGDGQVRLIDTAHLWRQP